MSRLNIQPARLRLIVLLAIVVAGFVIFDPLGGKSRSIQADFVRTTGLYAGDDVRVLGVTVGKITKIVPQGQTVRVRMSIDSSVRIPADVKAAIVAPSLVSGRFVQLAPAYTSGPELPARATIALSHTAAPVEFDQVKDELKQLAAALGPDGVGGPGGSLNRLIDEVSANLGNDTAAQLKNSIAAMREAADTLVGGRGDLFATIKNLDDFTRNLVVNDAAVRGFSSQLSQFSTVLADNRTQLATAVDALNQTLGELKTFVNDNHVPIVDSVKSLTTLAQTVADKSNSLAAILQVAPFSVDDLYNSIARSAIKGQVNLANVDSLAQVVCGSLLSVGGTTQQCQSALLPLVGLLGSTSVAVPAGQPAAGSILPSVPTGGSSLTGLLGGTSGVLGSVTGVVPGAGSASGQGGLLGLLLPGGGS